MLKIVTFNIRCDYGQDGKNGFSFRKDLIRRKIEKENPEVICFQEVLPHVAEWLRTELAQYYAVGCGREAALDGEQMTVLFRKERFSLIHMDTYWLSPEPYRPGSRYAEQSNCPRTCTEVVLYDLEAKRALRVINTHLDHLYSEARRLGLLQILKRIEEEKFLPELPVILAGDFNADPGDPELEPMNAPEIKDLTGETGITFHGFFLGEKPQKIDYIYLVGEQTRKQLSWIRTEKWEDHEGELWLSDHYPVCTCLEWR